MTKFKIIEKYILTKNYKSIFKKVHFLKNGVKAFKVEPNK